MFGFCTADFLSLLAYESAEQKPKHCLTSGFLIPLILLRLFTQRQWQSDQSVVPLIEKHFEVFVIVEANGLKSIYRNDVGFHQMTHRMFQNQKIKVVRKSCTKNSESSTLCGISSVVMLCLVIFLKLGLPMRLHSFCRVSPTASGTFQNKWQTAERLSAMNCEIF